MKKRNLLHVPIVGDDLRPLGVINARDALLVLLEGSEYEEAGFCVITSWALDIGEVTHDRALARWEWEGGSVEPDWEKRAALIQEEEHILHCLGAAVIMRWSNLPT